MTMYDAVLSKREDMSYAERRIIAEILKEAFIHNDSVPKVIKLSDAEYVSEEDLNKYTFNMGIRVTKVESKYTSLKPGNWICNLIIKVESDSKFGFDVN